MEGWEQLLSPGGPFDTAGRLIITVAFFTWNVFEGALFHTPYPVEWVYLYKFPYWRLFLVITLLVAAAWCPRVGSMAALALFFYLGDLERLTTPWMPPKKETKE